MTLSVLLVVLPPFGDTITLSRRDGASVDMLTFLVWALVARGVVLKAGLSTDTGLSHPPPPPVTLCSLLANELDKNIK
jgi:hypothetical protein